MPEPTGSPETRAARLGRALDYPYAWPGRCFLFRGDEPVPVDDRVDDRVARRAGRTPVLAFGSNRAPEQLKRKFGALDDAAAILVEACSLEGFDVVHAARITSYGAFPAALVPAPGVRVEIAVTWLDDAQLVRMDETEAVGVNYARAVIGVPVRLADGSVIADAEFYRTTHAPLRLDGVVVSHAGVIAEGRRGPVAGNQELLRRAHAVHGAGLDFEDFLIRLADDPAWRARLTRRLKAGL